MKTTGIRVLDDAPQIVAEWLDLLQVDLNWHDRDQAYLLLRQTLHALRDFLTVDEAAGLAAKLPTLLRGIYFEGWVPSNTPPHSRSADDFLDRVMKPFQSRPPTEPDAAVSAVLALLRCQIILSEYDQTALRAREPSPDMRM